MSYSVCTVHIPGIAQVHNSLSKTYQDVPHDSSLSFVTAHVGRSTGRIVSTNHNSSPISPLSSNCPAAMIRERCQRRCSIFPIPVKHDLPRNNQQRHKQLLVQRLLHPKSPTLPTYTSYTENSCPRMGHLIMAYAHIPRRRLLLYIFSMNLMLSRSVSG